VWGLDSCDRRSHTEVSQGGVTKSSHKPAPSALLHLVVSPYAAVLTDQLNDRSAVLIDQLNVSNYLALYKCSLDLHCDRSVQREACDAKLLTHNAAAGGPPPPPPPPPPPGGKGVFVQVHACLQREHDVRI